MLIECPASSACSALLFSLKLLGSGQCPDTKPALAPWFLVGKYEQYGESRDVNLQPQCHADALGVADTPQVKCTPTPSGRVAY